MRIFFGTLRFLAVTAACGLPVTAGLVSAGDVAADPGADLRLATRPGTPPAERLAAIDRVLESAPVLSASDAARAVQAAMGLLLDGSDRAARLLLRALDSGEVPEDLLERARQVVRQALAQPPPSTGDDGVAACALVLGLRGPAARLFARPLSDAVRRIVAQDAPELVGADGALVPELWAQPSGGPAWARHVELAALLDAACADDPRVAQPALSALVARGADAFPLLLATATPPTPLVDPTVRVYRAAAARTAIPGRLPRRVRAIVALGALRDRRATPVLIACLSDQDDGWARVAAANALGDIGDPAAAVALCNLLSYAGDRHRVRDGWDYPGSSETDVPQADWNDVEYYAVDANAADALLRLGLRDAAGWLIENRLRVTTGRWRIRVLQDAVDAIRRAFPGAPRDYVPDAGVPSRDKAWRVLAGWWRSGPKLAVRFDESDPGFRAAVRELVGWLGRRNILRATIAENSIRLLGPAATPTLLEEVAADTGTSRRAELAKALGSVRDRRATETLLGLAADPLATVRSAAAEALGTYAGSSPLVEGTSKVSNDEILARLLPLLGDRAASVRIGAMRGLLHAARSPKVLEAVEAHASALHPENAMPEYQVPEAVVLVLQGKDGPEALVRLTQGATLSARRLAWEALRAALPLETGDFDPTPGPGTPAARALDPALLHAMLEARKGP